MKIAYIHPALDSIAGVDRIITEKANFFATQYGFEVYIITAHQNNHELFFPLSKNIKHIDLGVNFREQYRHSFFLRGLIYFQLLYKYRKKLETLLKDLRVDFTLSTISRDIDFLYRLKDGSKKIAESHTPKAYVRNLHKLKEKGVLYRIAHKLWTYKLEKAIKNFDGFVVLTEYDAQNWRKIRNATVIPNSFPFYPVEASSCKSKKIICVGRLDIGKGYDLLIESWTMIHKKYPGWSIHIYGDGLILDSLKELIVDNNIENSFYIEKPTSAIEKEYLDSSIYVMSSRFEGFPMVLLEAMACGLPVVSFDCPYGPADIITDGQDGFLVENGNTSKLADRISFLIDHEDIRIQMAKKARENVKRYSQETIMQKWNALFESLKKE